jgi:hypothetical protein
MVRLEILIGSAALAARAKLAHHLGRAQGGPEKEEDGNDGDA